jgi:hypothetical protein
MSILRISHALSLDHDILSSSRCHLPSHQLFCNTSKASLRCISISSFILSGSDAVRANNSSDCIHS